MDHHLNEQTFGCVGDAKSVSDSFGNRPGAIRAGAGNTGVSRDNQAMEGAPQQVPPLSVVAQNLGAAENLAIRVLEMVERLTGFAAGAQPADTSISRTEVSGALHAVSALSRRTGDTVSAAHKALSHLENLL